MSTDVSDIRGALTVAVGGWRVPLIAFSCAVLGLLILPVIVIYLTAVTDQPYIGLPENGLSMGWLKAVFTDPTWRDPLLLSLKLSTLSALTAGVLGTAGALGARRLGVRASLANTLFIAPLILPPIVYALGVFNVVHAIDPQGMGSIPIYVGLTIQVVPLVFVTVNASLAAGDESLIDAAASLGARWPTIVRRVELPQVRTGILAGVMFAFAVSFDELTIALFLATPGVNTLSVEVYTSAQESVSPVVAAASVVVATGALLAVALAGIFTYLGHRQRTNGGRA